MKTRLCLSSLLSLGSVNWQRPALNSIIVLGDTFEHVMDRCWTRLTLPVKSVFDQLTTIEHWCQLSRISLVSTRWMRTAPSIEFPFNRFQYTQFPSLKISSVWRDVPIDRGLTSSSRLVTGRQWLSTRCTDPRRDQSQRWSSKTQWILSRKAWSSQSTGVEVLLL